MISKKQMNELKTQLEKRFAALREEIRQELLAFDNEQYNLTAGQVHDIGDDSLADFLLDMNLAVIDRHIYEVKEIEAALLRMSDGQYGLCIDCNVSIKPQRLEVQPTATRCIKCQATHEKSSKVIGL